MTTLGIYAKDRDVFEEFYRAQVILAKNRIAHFKKLDEIFENFKGYEYLKYKESRNKVFIDCIHRIKWLDLSFLEYDPEYKNKNLEPYKLLVNNGDYPNIIQILEDCISLFGIDSWNRKKINEFRSKLTSYDYSTSFSLVSEMLTAYDIGKNIGFDNVVFNPKLATNNVGDIQAIVNSKKIVLELTSTNPAESENKIQRIFDYLAEYISQKCVLKIFNISIYVDTYFLLTDDKGRIDEKNSKNMLAEWVDLFQINELAGCNASINFDYDFSWIQDKTYLGELTSDHFFDKQFSKQMDKQQQLKDWANKIRIKDIAACPFTHIGCGTDGNGDLVQIHGNNFYPSLVGRLEEKSFLDKLKRTVKEKVTKHQFERNQPGIIFLKTRLWSSSFEYDSSDFSKMKPIIESELEKTSSISGLLVYDSNFKNGRYIANKNASDAIKLSKQELIQLGIRHDH